MSSAGTPSGSSLGVGAWSTGALRGGTGAPSASTGTAQVTDQCGRRRSSRGRSARSAASSGPLRTRTRQRVVTLSRPPDAASSRTSSTATYGPSVLRRRMRVPDSVSTTTSSRPGRARRRESSMASMSRAASACAAASRSGRITTVSYGSGAEPSAANGSLSNGTWPSRRRSSSPRPGLCRAVSAARPRASASDQRTPPVRPTTAGSSVTARTAANPTPNRPTAPAALLALGGGTQRGQRLDTGGVQRRAGVRGDEHSVAQGQGEATT